MCVYFGIKSKKFFIFRQEKTLHSVHHVDPYSEAVIILVFFIS
ncbi:MAG: hypothetical protein ACI8RD_009266 [Bacillariaceae sp.]|jgi:hypothetical protein